MPKKAGKAKQPKVKKTSHAASAASALDWPDDKWEKFGIKHYDMLLAKRKSQRRLVAYEEHLLLKHFPSLWKRVGKEQQAKEAEKKRKQSEEEAKQARKEQHSAEQAEAYTQYV